MTKSRFKPVMLAGAVLVSMASLAHAQVSTDVLVRDGTGTTIANNVSDFDWSSAGSGLAVGFQPTVGNTFTFLYQANLVGFLDADGNAITPLAGLNQSFASGGYEFTVAARITEEVTGFSIGADGSQTATFKATAGTASIFFDNAASGGVKANTPTGNGFDDGKLLGVFNVIPGAGTSSFTTFLNGNGIGATKYDFVVAAGGVDASFIMGLLGPVGDLHFVSNQTLPVGNSQTGSFHNNSPTGSSDLYPTTASAEGLLLKVDGSNTFTTAVPEPETYALMLAGFGALGFLARRRRV